MALTALAENLKLTSGDNHVTKTTSYIVPHKHVTSDVPSPASSGTEESHLASTTPVLNDIEGVEDHAEDVANSVFKAIPRRRLKRSASYLAFLSGPQHEAKTAVVTLNAFQSKDDMYRSQHAVPSLLRSSLQPSRTPEGRPVTKPRNELDSGEHKAAKSSVSFNRNPRAGHPRRRSTGNKALTGTRPFSTRYTALRSSSDSDLSRAFIDPKLHGRHPPSKSCIKQRAKSDTSMPPNALQRCTTETGSKALQRIKTVSFKGNSRQGREHSHPAPEVTSISKISSDALTRDGNTHPSRANKQRSMFRNSLSFPNAIFAVKRRVADSAITRTDVYVIAVSPSWDARDIVNEEGVDIATPTMQTIETRSGGYEVVWDDVSPEQNIRARGRWSSSASHSLETASFGVRHGLKRVDSRLAYWSGTWNSASDSFNPTVAVFPDDDGRARSFECTIEDQEDLLLPVPPNSQVTSVTSSRHASRQASRSLTRTASSEDMLSDVSVNGRHQHAVQDLPQPSEESLFVPRPQDQRKGRRNKYPAMVRQLPSLEEAGSHFCSHRDSVSITHERLTHLERASPKPFEQQDSYTIAKKRMNNGDEDMLAESASTSSNDLSTEIDNGITEVSLPVVKEHARQALKNSRPISILRSPQHLTDRQHVRIVE